MKKFSVVLPALALILAVTAAFAFTPAPQKSLNGELWFEYISGDMSDPLNYQLYDGTGQSTPTCTTGSTRCAVFVAADANDPDHPDQTALQTVSSPNIKNKN